MADNENKTNELPEDDPGTENEVVAGDEPTVDDVVVADAGDKEGEEAGSEDDDKELASDDSSEGELEEPEISKYEKVAALMQGTLREDLPQFRPGDTVKVHVKIIEGTKERIQVFEGVVIALKHGGLDRTFKVRKTSWGVGVERTFFLNSPKIDRIEVTRHGFVRRAKLYYLRQRAGKSARIKERRMKAKS